MEAGRIRVKAAFTSTEEQVSGTGRVLWKEGLQKKEVCQSYPGGNKPSLGNSKSQMRERGVYSRWVAENPLHPRLWEGTYAEASKKTPIRARGEGGKGGKGKNQADRNLQVSSICKETFDTRRKSRQARKKRITGRQKEKMGMRGDGAGRGGNLNTPSCQEEQGRKTSSLFLSTRMVGRPEFVREPLRERKRAIDKPLSTATREG